LSWLFAVLCVSKWTLWLIFHSLWWMTLEFWWGLHWTFRLLLIVQPFSYVDFVNPWAWEIFPSSVVLFTVCSFPHRGFSYPLLSIF
jgi:hypothetical protein